MDTVLKKLLKHYYICYILLVASAVVGFYLALNFRFTEPNAQYVTTLGIALLLLSIPYSFHYYKKQIEQVKQLDEEKLLQKIVKVVDIRLAIVCVPLMYNIVMYYLTANVSLIFAAGMSALILIYIKPNKNIFLKDLSDEDDNTNE